MEQQIKAKPVSTEQLTEVLSSAPLGDLAQLAPPSYASAIQQQPHTSFGYADSPAFSKKKGLASGLQSSLIPLPWVPYDEGFKPDADNNSASKILTTFTPVGIEGSGKLASSFGQVSCSAVLEMEQVREDNTPEADLSCQELTTSAACFKTLRKVQENAVTLATPSQFSFEGGMSDILSHGSDSNDYTCDNCGKKLRSRFRLKRHLHLHNTESEHEYVRLNAVSTNRGRPIQATVNLQSLNPEPKELTQLNADVHGYAKLNVGDSTSSKLSIDEKKLTRDKLDPFDMCEVSFIEGSEITKHKNVKNYPCDMCASTFPSNSQLISHKRTSECNQRFVCKMCEARFTTKSQLTNHKKTSNCDKRYVCNFCEARFNRISHLTIHIRTHTGDRPFVCSVCDARFTVKSHLTAHKRTHTGEKPYGCNLCSARFSKSCHLTIHNRSHTGEKPYGCSVCKARFSTNSHLTAHKRIHTGDKPYSCDLCGARFNKSSYVTTHIRSHTGEKPYGCDVCKARFSQSSGLSTHKKMHMRKTTSI